MRSDAVTMRSMLFLLLPAAVARRNQSRSMSGEERSSNSAVEAVTAFLEAQAPQHAVPAMLALLVAWIIGRLVYEYTLERRCGVPVINGSPEGRSWPWLGHALSFLSHSPWDLLTSWHMRHGSILCFQLVGTTMFSLGSPALIKQALQSKIEGVKKDVQKTMKPFLCILGSGIVTSEDDAWLSQRLKMSMPLRQHVLTIIPKQTLLALQRLMQQWDDACEQGQPVPVASSLRHLTLQVISGTFLSLDHQESDQHFAKLYLPIVDESNLRVWHPYRAYLPTPAWFRQLRNVRRLNQYVSSLIVQRWKSRRDGTHSLDNDDILDHVLRVYEKQTPIPKTLPAHCVRQVRDEMKTFMLAGHETSAAMMTWALYELLDNGDYLKRLRKEASRVFDDSIDWRSANSASQLPSDETLAKLVFSEATLKEALRKYSVVPTVARRAIKDLHLVEDDQHYLIPKGSSILVNIQTVHHDPRWWPEPMTFDPTRHMQTAAPYTFLAFIAGPRNCLGQYLALLESKMVIALLCQRYQLDKVTQTTGDPRHRFMVPVIPQEELLVRVQRR